MKALKKTFMGQTEYTQRLIFTLEMKVINLQVAWPEFLKQFPLYMHYRAHTIAQG